MSNPAEVKLVSAYNAAGGKNAAMPWDLILDLLIGYLKNMCPTVEASKRFVKRHPIVAAEMLKASLDHDAPSISSKDRKLVVEASMTVFNATSAAKLKEMM